ncbi:MAG: lytic transglycosylase domain-containing protein [Candidatus Binataceae bacterium]
MAFRGEIGKGRRLSRLPRGVAALLAAGLLLLVAGSGRARADWSAAAPAASENLYAKAAAQEHVPLDLLVAIAGAESGYHPWALNLDGHEIYCRSRDEAERRLATGDKVAIGLMQINWLYWGPRLRLSKNQMLDPATNLIYGARILRLGLGRSGSIWFRISNYHSGSLAARDAYNQRVYANYLRYLRGEVGR